MCLVVVDILFIYIFLNALYIRHLKYILERPIEKWIADSKMTQLKVKKFIEWVFRVFICYLSVIYLCIHWLLLFVHLLAATEGWWSSEGRSVFRVFSGLYRCLSSAQLGSGGKQKHYGFQSVSYSGNTVLQLKYNDSKRFLPSACYARRCFGSVG